MLRRISLLIILFCVGNQANTNNLKIDLKKDRYLLKAEHDGVNALSADQLRRHGDHWPVVDDVNLDGTKILRRWYWRRCR